MSMARPTSSEVSNVQVDARASYKLVIKAIWRGQIVFLSFVIIVACLYAGKPRQRAGKQAKDSA